MTTQTVSKIILTFLLFIALQLLVLRGLVIQDYAFCFMYIACVLLLPIEVSPSWVITIGFLVGLIIDIFYDTAGVHTSATVLIAFLRPYVLRLLLPNRGVDADVAISAQGMGLERFVRYIFIMTLIHHTMLFFVEAGTFQFFVVTIIKIISSVLYTTISIVLIHLLFRGLQHR